MLQLYVDVDSSKTFVDVDSSKSFVTGSVELSVFTIRKPIPRATNKHMIITIILVLIIQLFFSRPFYSIFIASLSLLTSTPSSLTAPINKEIIALTSSPSSILTFLAKVNIYFKCYFFKVFRFLSIHLYKP